MKKNNNKGFTLAELLIVVAIIAVLTAIAIPVFSTQLEKAKEATDLANLRAAYAEINTKYLESGTVPDAIDVATTQSTPTSWVTENPKVGNIDMTSKTASTNGWTVSGVVDSTSKEFSISIAAK